MPHTVVERVTRWGQDSTDSVGFLALWDQVEYLADKRFAEYHPAYGPVPEFRVRVRDWLNRLPSEDDQRILYRMIPRLFFVGSDEFRSMYRSALHGPLVRWLIEDMSLTLQEASSTTVLAEAIDKTWFCPITDSMGIAEFHHVNRIAGINYRPDWSSMSKFGDVSKITSFMAASNLERLVLLEDFVGSGKQMRSAAQFAAKLPYEILLLPLLVCPNGAAAGNSLATSFANVTFRPLLQIEEIGFIQKGQVAGEDALFTATRELINRIHLTVSNGVVPNPFIKPYGPFGFADTGALVVMHSNCPDNTVPIIHHSSDTWDPLFPRSSRI